MNIHIVCEGKLEVLVARRIIEFCGHICGYKYNLKGSGNIKKEAVKYKDLAINQTAVLVLTDFMDSDSICPLEAKKKYLGDYYTSIHPNFLLRFAVNELESWLLADRKNISCMLGVKKEKNSHTSRYGV